MRTPKENKQKLRDRTPKSTAGTIPKAAARVHTAGERGVSPKQTECSTLPDADPHPRRGADLPRRRAKEKNITAKTAPR